uniref:VHS domain-containing protein n=1 Tax=Elaeophora elaphi TaxID=1147741 RepID=A0A0R3RZ26_9BILA
MSSLISWLRVLYQFQESIHRALSKYDEWRDLCMCKALSEALDLRDDLILTVCQSSPNEVKRYGMAMNGCASCKLMLFLLHCSMRKDETERHNYWGSHSSDLQSFIASKSDRKLALVALLNSWQQLLEPHIKIADVLTAKKYSRGLLPESIKSGVETFTTTGEGNVTTERIARSTVSPPLFNSMANSAVRDDVRIHKGITLI